MANFHHSLPDHRFARLTHSLVTVTEIGVKKKTQYLRITHQLRALGNTNTPFSWNCHACTIRVLAAASELPRLCHFVIAPFDSANIACDIILGFSVPVGPNRARKPNIVKFEQRARHSEIDQ